MITFEKVTFTYPGASQPVLRQVSLSIPTGTLCLVTGPSGSGKSTLLRLTNGLVPHFSGGSLQGSLRVDGLDPVRLSPREMSRQVGFVFQDPEAQFVVDVVEDEIAFALENAALPPAEMRTRVDEVLRLLELEGLRKRRLETLSGGERQRVAIAAALALRPHILALDEPTSQLDPHGADEVLQRLVHLNQSLGLTILLVEHRLERVLPYAGQLVYLDGSSPGLLSGPPRQVLEQIPLRPPLVELGIALGWRPLPLTIPAAQELIQREGIHIPASPLEPEASRMTRPFVQAQGLQVSYGSLPALRGVDLELFPGEIAVLMGANGSGKTTLLRSLVGLVRPQAGRVWVGGQDTAGLPVAEICRQVAYLPQDPNALLFSDSVLEELETTLRFQRQAAPTSDSKLDPRELLTELGLAGKAQAYPRDLSAGERQRVALGAVTIFSPPALLLDEPTRGLDYQAKRSLAALLRTWRAEGKAILLVTHDVELAAHVADRVILLEGGSVIAAGRPETVLGADSPFAPQMVRLFPGAGWLTVEAALQGLGKPPTQS